MLSSNIVSLILMVWCVSLLVMASVKRCTKILKFLIMVKEDMDH